MKKILLFVLIFSSLSVKSQHVFQYEKEVSNPQDFDFQELDFENPEIHIKLSGTLIEPKSNFEKIVIIVPGSGKDTRHSHFVLTERLLKNNIAVFRFDERGVGKSEGNYSELAKDLSNDLKYAFREIQKKYSDKKVGLVGHSIGGIAVLENISGDVYPDFVVLIEVPIVKNGDFVLNQFRMDYENSFPKIMREGKTKDEMLVFIEGYFQIIKECSKKSIRKEIKEYIKAKGFDRRFIVLLDDSFLMEMATIDVEGVFKNISIKTLYLTGTSNKVINYKKETDLIKSFKNPNIEIRIFEGLNHYLSNREGTVGSSLYDMDKEPLSILIKWILAK